MHLTIKFAAQATALLVLVSAAATVRPACAQQAGTTPRPGTRSINADPARSDLERDLVTKELEEGRGRRPAERQASPAVFAQLAEDFTRIQVVNNELVLAAARVEALDLKFVAKSTAEVKKLAQRLKTNLVLPEPEAAPKRAKLGPDTDAEQLKAALVTLGKLIAGFAHNPVFKQANVVDAQLSVKARLDLEEIIDLSGQVMKNSEKLSKAAPKAP
jgi:hypothetical protein